MKTVFTVLIAGLFVLGLALSASAQTSGQPGTSGSQSGTTGSQPGTSGSQPGTTGSQQPGMTGTSGMQQDKESMSFTVTKIEKEQGKVNLETADGTKIEVNFPDTKSEEAQKFLQDLDEGDRVTVQVGGLGTMGTGGASGTTGGSQQQKKKQ